MKIGATLIHFSRFFIFISFSLFFHPPFSSSFHSLLPSLHHHSHQLHSHLADHPHHQHLSHQPYSHFAHHHLHQDDFDKYNIHYPRHHHHHIKILLVLIFIHLSTFQNKFFKQVYVFVEK